MTRQEVMLWKRLRELRELGFHFRRRSTLSISSADGGG
jgi:very-short-patch-repair endonuclease